MRVKNPNAAYILIPWFIPTNQSREDIFLELLDRMKDGAEETFVLLAIEGRRILGMVIAYCRTSDVFLWQARSDGLAGKYVDMAFDGVCSWARGKGMDRIVTKPNRAHKLWKRRWGFEHLAFDEMYKEI